jgi:type II secretory pathway pseudopilin PulG
MKNHRGLILIELIAVIILIGIIATFGGVFLYKGFTGYLETKNTTEGALTAQMALDRISLELRDLKEFTSTPTPNPQPDEYVSFKSEVFSGTRVIKYDANANTIELSINNTDYTLLENVSWFSLSVTPDDLDNDGSDDDVAYIEVGFKVGFDEYEIGRKFITKIFPRHMVEN